MTPSNSNNFAAIKNSLIPPVLGQFIDNVPHCRQGPDGVWGHRRSQPGRGTLRRRRRERVRARVMSGCRGRRREEAAGGRCFVLQQEVSAWIWVDVVVILQRRSQILCYKSRNQITLAFLAWCGLKIYCVVCPMYRNLPYLNCRCVGQKKQQHHLVVNTTNQL